MPTQVPFSNFMSSSCLHQNGAAMINCLEISGNQQFLFSGDSFGVVKAWEIPKGLSLFESKRCHQSFIYLNGMASTKKNQLITTSRSDEIRIWSNQLEPLGSLPFPADCIKLGHDQVTLIAGRENVVKVFSLATKEEISEHVFPVSCIAF